MIRAFLAYLQSRAWLVIDEVGPVVFVPREVVEHLRARPGRRLRTRFDVVEPVEAERTVFFVETETQEEVV